MSVDLMAGQVVGRASGEIADLGGELQLRFCWCPPGQFAMGAAAGDADALEDERPQHVVTLTQGFWLGQTAVTQEQYAQVMGRHPWRNKEFVVSRERCPVTYVSWDDAAEFCSKLTAREQEAGRIPTGWAFRLPTEAEWEYACRAGTTTQFHMGDDDEVLPEHAWFIRNAWSTNERYPHEVGTKLPNAWNLHDMHGNVYEWCADWYTPDYYRVASPSDPPGPIVSSSRVRRGGSWRAAAGLCRSSSRGFESPAMRSYYIGFRIALSPLTEGQATLPSSSSSSRTQNRHMVEAGKVRELAGDLLIKFAWIPPGKFIMGSSRTEYGNEEDERPRHWVRLTEGQWMMQTVVTQSLWTTLMETTPWTADPQVPRGPNFPAIFISWEDASNFCLVLNQREVRAGRLPRGWSYRLPTEAEWEYACRAGTTTVFSFGDDPEDLGDYAWYEKNAWNVGEQYAHEVGLKRPNPWNLLDMHGNVYEWCLDWYAADYYAHSPVDNPPGAARASGRVYRGGCWDSSAAYSRSAYRYWYDPSLRSRYLGFRVVLSPIWTKEA